ncbi:MAG: hypothetical protein ABSB83_04430 [Methanomassiliicoccales archaeon]|jgi:hypothetical protein
MTSNAELFIALENKVERPKERELREYVRLEFPLKGKVELESDMERTAFLLKSQHKVEITLGKKAFGFE